MEGQSLATPLPFAFSLPWEHISFPSSFHPIWHFLPFADPVVHGASSGLVPSSLPITWLTLPPNPLGLVPCLVLAGKGRKWSPSHSPFPSLCSHCHEPVSPKPHMSRKNGSASEQMSTKESGILVPYTPVVPPRSSSVSQYH